MDSSTKFDRDHHGWKIHLLPGQEVSFDKSQSRLSLKGSALLRDRPQSELIASQSHERWSLRPVVARSCDRLMNDTAMLTVPQLAERSDLKGLCIIQCTDRT